MAKADRARRWGGLFFSSSTRSKKLQSQSRLRDAAMAVFEPLEGRTLLSSTLAVRAVSRQIINGNVSSTVSVVGTPDGNGFVNIATSSDDSILKAGD